MYSWMFKLYSMKSWTPDRDQDRPMDIMLLILAFFTNKINSLWQSDRNHLQCFKLADIFIYNISEINMKENKKTQKMNKQFTEVQIHIAKEYILASEWS